MHGVRLWSNLTNQVFFIQKKVHENKVVKGLLVFLASLIVGIAVYHSLHPWDLSLSYFYAASVLLGDLFLVPEDDNSLSQVFTLVYFLWGCCLMASALAISAETLIEKAVKIASDERKRILLASQLTEKLIDKQHRKRNSPSRTKAQNLSSPPQSGDSRSGHRQDNSGKSNWWGSGYQHHSEVKLNGEVSRSDKRVHDLVMSSRDDFDADAMGLRPLSPAELSPTTVDNIGESSRKEFSGGYSIDVSEVDDDSASQATRPSTISNNNRVSKHKVHLTLGDRIVIVLDTILLSIGWDYHRSKYLALSFVFLWSLVGVAYGMMYEEWPFSRALFFTASAISAAGTSPPVCEGDAPDTCQLGTLRALFVGTYVIVGVPIFAYSLAQFAEYLLEKVVRANELKLMMNPITRPEFQYVLSLKKGIIPQDSVDEYESMPTPRGGSLKNSVMRPTRSRQLSMASTTSLSTTSLLDSTRERTSGKDLKVLGLDFGDFVILELLRLKKITRGDLEYIKTIYDAINREQEATLTSLATPSASTVPSRRTSVFQGLVPLAPIAEEEVSSLSPLVSVDGEESFSTRSSVSEKLMLSKRMNGNSSNDLQIWNEHDEGTPLMGSNKQASGSLSISIPSTAASAKQATKATAQEPAEITEEEEDSQEYTLPYLENLPEDEQQDEFTLEYNKLMLPAMHQLQLQSSLLNKATAHATTPFEELADSDHSARLLHSLRTVTDIKFLPSASVSDDDDLNYETASDNDSDDDTVHTVAEDSPR